MYAVAPRERVASDKPRCPAVLAASQAGLNAAVIVEADSAAVARLQRPAPVAREAGGGPQAAVSSSGGGDAVPACARRLSPPSVTPSFGRESPACGARGGPELALGVLGEALGAVCEEVPVRTAGGHEVRFGSSGGLRHAGGELGGFVVDQGGIGSLLRVVAASCGCYRVAPTRRNSFCRRDLYRPGREELAGGRARRGRSSTSGR